MLQLPTPTVSMSSSLLWNLGHQDQFSSRKETIVAWYQTRAVCHTFQDFPSEALQEFLSHFGTVWPRIVMLKQHTFCKQSRAYPFQAGLNPSSVIHTVCTCIDSCSLLHEVSQQHTFMGPKHGAHHFASRVHNPIFLHSWWPRMFPFHACTFHHQGMVVKQYVIFRGIDDH